MAKEILKVDMTKFLIFMVILCFKNHFVFYIFHNDSCGNLGRETGLRKKLGQQIQLDHLVGGSILTCGFQLVENQLAPQGILEFNVIFWIKIGVILESFGIFIFCLFILSDE